MFVEDKHCAEIGDGFVSKIKTWKKAVSWADIVIFDYTGFGAEAEALRSAGKPVIGGTHYTDRLENDRHFGQTELKKHGIKITHSREFSRFEDAIDFIREHPGKYVIKPCGEIAEYKQLVFVGNEEDGSDIVRILRAYQKTWGDEMGVFQLQKKISGVEIAVGAFFNGRKFCSPICVNFEHKKLFPRELGVATGEMGTSLFWDSQNPIFDATLAKMEKALAKENYVGYIDLNCIANGNGVYPLEFTTRFGFPTIAIQRAGFSEPVGEFLWKMANGVDFCLKTIKGFSVGLLMVVPPFPYDDPKTFDSFSRDAVVVFKKKIKEGIHPQHLKCVNGEWLITGELGIALVISGAGTTMREAQRQMYHRVANVVIPNAYWRTDIGDRWAEDSDKLWSWNYL